MSRTFKFRVWSEDQKTYDYKFPYNSIGDFYVNTRGKVFSDFGNTVAPEVRQDAFIIEQYTGLKDKNGKEIYEGDIVEEDIDFNSKMTDGTFRYKVYWNDDELYWSLDPIGPESIHNDLWELNSSCRVIGNIHENKELWGESV